MIPPLFKSSEVAERAGRQGGSNYAYLTDPEIDKAIDEAMQESNIERQWKLWGELDSKISQKAASIPIIYSNAIRLHGSNVSGAFIHAGFGMPDLSALGLLDPGGSPCLEIDQVSLSSRPQPQPKDFDHAEPLSPTR